MNFQIKNKETQAVIFECEFTDDELATEISPEGVVLKRLDDDKQLGYAIKKALNNNIDLSGADLRGAYLVGFDLRNANLSGTDLSGADLEGAYLYKANLMNANLSNANLDNANLKGAILGSTSVSPDMVSTNGN